MTISRLAFSVMALVLAGVAAGAAPDPLPRTLTVTGLGTAKAAPDEANFSAGVVSQGATASQALAANSRAMNAVFATLKKQGIPEKAIQTSNLSLSPQYQPCKPNVACPQRIVGYEVSNNVSVTTGLDKAGPVLDALVASGSNQFGAISFSIHDPKPLLAQARVDAVKDALERGALYAKAAGVSLGPILSIQEGGSEAPRPMLYAMRNKAMAGEAMPVAGGEESVSANVSITWTIN
jgi:uncharacterized protein YggE